MRDGPIVGEKTPPLQSKPRRAGLSSPLAAPGEPGIMPDMSDDDPQAGGDGGFDGGDHDGHHDDGGHSHGDGECGCDHEDCGCGDFQAEQRPYDEMERSSRSSGCVLILLALPATGLLLWCW
jgi:hypothetical protein